MHGVNDRVSCVSAVQGPASSLAVGVHAAPSPSGVCWALVASSPVTELHCRHCLGVR